MPAQHTIYSWQLNDEPDIYEIPSEEGYAFQDIVNTYGEPDLSEFN